ncbi:hypothetical protein Golomagni_05017 [Golovinomyces magnicellulatus]|nr:hypothetical protein Golomagni_05017 [Golovinomyces magnicellulatus]
MATEQELIELSLPEFWNARYEAELAAKLDQEEVESASINSYEWFRTYDKLVPFFRKHIPSPSSAVQILHLGCGNSTLTSDFTHDGYTNQISVDFSPVLIQAMKKTYASLQTQWLVMDVRDLQLEKESVHIAIDKGTLDAFLHGSLWEPPSDVTDNVGKYVDQVVKVLKPGGKWLYITYRQPHFIKPLLSRCAWKLDVEALEDPNGAGGFSYYGFVMTKH